ncbi:hypothetical protein [Actinoplanes sp. NPDC020271]|uniref:hypothetical protein n=1 Tax=Actinoplanes sp. NPDC020271 TaxID=3363896 RepID=UPI0037A149C2
MHTDGIPDTPEPAPDGDAVQDLVNHLLHGALQISHALDELHKLAHHPAITDPDGLDQVSDAITTMTRARTALLRDADRLTADLP